MYLENKLKELSQLRPGIFVFHLYLDWLIIVMAISFDLYIDHWASYLLSIIIIASRQQALGVLSHDIVHFRFLKNKKLADWIGNIFMTWPLFFTIPGYRSMHLRHHQYVNSDKDPDWTRREGKSDWIFPMKKAHVYKMLFLDMSGLNLYQNIQKLYLPKQDKKLKSDFSKVPTSYYIFMGMYYLIGLGLISYFNFWYEFLIYWIVPYFTLFKLIKRLRAVGEHFCIPDKKIEQITRTTLANPLEEFLFSQHKINYHIEHHRYPGVPYYNLVKLHKFLQSQGKLEKMGHINSKGYLRGLIPEMSGFCQLNKKS